MNCTHHVCGFVPGRRRTGEAGQQEQVDTLRAPSGYGALYVLVLGGAHRHRLHRVGRPGCTGGHTRRQSRRQSEAIPNRAQAKWARWAVDTFENMTLQVIYGSDISILTTVNSH